MSARDDNGRFKSEKPNGYAEAVKRRRLYELALLERLRAEAAMPEWYPE